MTCDTEVCDVCVMGKRTRRHDEGFQRRDDVAASRHAHAFSEVGWFLVRLCRQTLFFFIYSFVFVWLFEYFFRLEVERIMLG